MNAPLLSSRVPPGTPAGRPARSAGASRAALTKAARQERIVALLAARVVRSQAELVRILREEGLEVTQATLSRDLEDLGATKLAGAYVVPTAGLVDGPRALPAAAAARLRRLCAELLVAAEAVGSQVVVRTPPGGAHLLAAALDRSGLAELVGTVAGDDTALLVFRTRSHAAGAVEMLLSMAGHVAPGVTNPHGRGGPQ